MRVDAPIFDRAALGAVYPEPFLFEGHRSITRLYRYVLGRPMNGRIYTDCTFFRDATSGYPSRWLRLAGWKRSAVRLGIPYLLLLTLTLYMLFVFVSVSVAMSVIADQLLVVLIVGVPITVTRLIAERGLVIKWPVKVQLESTIVRVSEQRTDESGRVSTALVPVERERFERRWQSVALRQGRRSWERETLLPVARVLVSKWGLPNAHSFPRSARRWVSVPRDYMQPGGKSVSIVVPERLAPSDGEKLTYERAIAAKLGMLEWRAEWLLNGAAPRLLMSVPLAPPKLITFAQVSKLLTATQEYRPFLGAVADELAHEQWSLLSAEMIADSPHIAVSAGSGAGKSMLTKVIVMQALRWGWSVIILDWKAASHTWAKGLDGVRYVTTEEGIHDLGVQLGEEVDTRKRITVDDQALSDDLPYPKILVVREEWNMTAALLAEYWSQLRSMASAEEKRAMPARSPALTGFMKLDFGGRQFGMFDLLIAQRMSNRVFNGNTDIRENFMIRLFARYTVQTWKMLVPHMKFIKKPREIGRWVVVAGDDATIIQGILTSDAEAREFAVGGVPNPLSPWAVAGSGASGASSPSTARTQEDQLGGRPTAPNADLPGEAPVRLLKLSDIAPILEPLGITLEMLRHGAKSTDTFPVALGGNQFAGYTYDLFAVRDWARSRIAAGAAKREVGR